MKMQHSDVSKGCKGSVRTIRGSLVKMQIPRPTQTPSRAGAWQCAFTCCPLVLRQLSSELNLGVWGSPLGTYPACACHLHRHSKGSSLNS